MFNNALTKVISHYCIFTEALPSLIHRGFRLLSSLPRLRFSSHHGEFTAITFGKDEVLPRANGAIVLSGTVCVKVTSRKILSMKPFLRASCNFFPGKYNKKLAFIWL